MFQIFHLFDMKYIRILHLIINEDNNIQTCSESQEEFESGAELLLHLQENLDTSGSKCCLELKKNKKNNVRFLNFMHNQVYFVLVFLFYKAKKNINLQFSQVKMFSISSMTGNEFNGNNSLLRFEYIEKLVILFLINAVESCCV